MATATHTEDDAIPTATQFPINRYIDYIEGDGLVPEYPFFSYLDSAIDNSEEWAEFDQTLKETLPDLEFADMRAFSPYRQKFAKLQHLAYAAFKFENLRDARQGAFNAYIEKKFNQGSVENQQWYLHEPRVGYDDIPRDLMVMIFERFRNRVHEYEQRCEHHHGLVTQHKTHNDNVERAHKTRIDDMERAHKTRIDDMERASTAAVKEHKTEIDNVLDELEGFKNETTSRARKRRRISGATTILAGGVSAFAYGSAYGMITAELSASVPAAIMASIPAVLTASPMIPAAGFAGVALTAFTCGFAL